MLNNTRFLDRILVVWNDIQRSVPSNLIPTISVPIFVLNATRNSLNNRFLPFDLIRTQAIFNMDDDFNTDLETFEFSFRYAIEFYPKLAFKSVERKSTRNCRS
jgi:hypothetical protein